MQNFLLYEASGDRHRLHGCRFALLQYLSRYNLKPPQPTTVVVHTDEPAWFDDLLPFFHQFELKEPTGCGDQVSFAEYASGRFSGNLLLADPATYPKAPLEPLFATLEKGNVVMYRCAPPAAGYKQNAGPLQDAQAKEGVFQPSILGFSTRRQPPWAELKTARENGKKDARGRPAGEVPFHKGLQKLAPINPANEYFADYFALDEFRDLLQLFFTKNAEESIPNLVKLIHYLDAPAIQKQKTAFEQLPLLKKWWSRLSGKGWYIRQYQNKIS